MPDNAHDSTTVTLSLHPAASWTLHHVLLDSLETDARSGEATGQKASSEAVSAAFERLDGGETTFTIPEVEAMQRVLATSHHSQRWELERPRLEELLRTVSARLDQADVAHP